MGPPSATPLGANIATELGETSPPAGSAEPGDARLPPVARILQGFRGLLFPSDPRGLSERARSRFAKMPIAWFALVASLTWLALSVYSGHVDLITYFSSVLTVEYSHHFYSYLLDYPPGWVESSSLLGWGYSVFFPAATIFQQPMIAPALRAAAAGTELGLLPAPLLVVTEKTVLLASDLLAGFIIYRLVLERSGDAGWAKLSLFAWLFNPLVLFESAVHGAYDVIPATFSVMAFYLTLHRRFLTAGAALGLGIWFKLFPVFFLPILLVVLWQAVGRSRPDFLKGAGLAAGGLGIVTAVVLWPPGLVQGWLGSIPTGVGNAFGGLGVWSFLSLNEFAPLKLWFYHHIAQALDVLYVVVASIMALIAWRLFRNRTAAPNSPGTHHALLASAIVIPSAAATVHPQYLVWAMPFFVLVLWERREYLIPYASVSGAVVAYQLTIHGGPLFWFQALAVDTPLLAPRTVLQSFAFWNPRAAEIIPWFQIPIALMLFATAVHSFQLIRQRRSP
jgi:uncharacterized membrane protein